MIASPLAGRLAKPRSRGQTMIIDKGLGLSQTGDQAHVRLSQPLRPALLRAKISLIRSYGIDVYPGGTFREVAFLQGALERYLDRAKAFGFTYIEMSVS